jgi:hypothetical protein
MQGQHRPLLVLPPLGRSVTSLAEANAIMRPMAVLDDWPPGMTLPPERFGMPIRAEAQRLRRAAQREEGWGGGGLAWPPRQAWQKGGRMGRPPAQSRGGLEHLVVVGAEQVPAARPRSDRWEGRRGVGLARCGPRALLTVEALEPREELTMEPVPNRQGHAALPPGSAIVFRHRHRGARA